MKFIEHGVFNIKIISNQLLVDAIGPFNEEVVSLYKATLESCIQELENSQWHQIITLHQTSLFTPEAEYILTKSLVDRKARGLHSCSLITVDVDFESLVKEQMSRCYNNAGVEHQYFESIAKAQTWIASFP